MNLGKYQMKILLFRMQIIAALFLMPLLHAEEGVPQRHFQEKIEVKIAAPRTLSYSVVLEPMYLTVVYAEVTSPILKIHKRMGESFEENEILIELDNRIFEGNYAKATAAVTRFESELEAKQALFKDDAMSRFELDQSIADLAGAIADQIIAKKGLEGTTIKAPYRGKVVKLALKEFELAQQGKELITLVDDDVLFAKFLAPSALVTCIKTGMPVEIDIKESGDRIKASISRIAPVIDPSSSTLMVEAKIDNKDHKWWGGMTGMIRISECDLFPHSTNSQSAH